MEDIPLTPIQARAVERQERMQLFRAQILEGAPVEEETLAVHIHDIGNQLAYLRKLSGTGYTPSYATKYIIPVITLTLERQLLKDDNYHHDAKLIYTIVDKILKEQSDHLAEFSHKMDEEVHNFRVVDIEAACRDTRKHMSTLLREDLNRNIGEHLANFLESITKKDAPSPITPEAVRDSQGEGGGKNDVWEL